MKKLLKSNLSTTVGLTFLTIGWLFYLGIRSWDPLGVFESINVSFDLPAAITGSLPTFLHALAAIFLLRGFCSHRETFVLAGVSTFGFEFLQAIEPRFGVFDVNDLVSIGSVFILYYFVIVFVPSEPKSSSRLLRKTVVLALVSLASVATTERVDDSYTHVPICMELSEFRSSFAVEESKEVTRAGRIFVNGDLLFISDPYRGIHVLDNSNPASPTGLAFLNIPGNTDIAMKNNYIYADSAIDLLTIKLEGSAITLVDRLENQFESIVDQPINEETLFYPRELVERCSANGGVVTGFDPREDGQEFKDAIEENKND